ncbi:MAG TPA: hypothetical protein VNP72_08665 [Longimicrobium sp.]|nr:hypothetical protein [Longimicrobium sp.]
MKKLRLRLEDVRVDSFATAQAQKGEGTVFGEQCTCRETCDSCNPTCAGWATKAGPGMPCNLCGG